MYKKVKEAKIEIIGGKKLTTDEVNELVEAIIEKIDPKAEIVWEAKIDNKMGNNVKMTALLTL